MSLVVSNERVKEITTKIACTVQGNMVQFNDVYVSPGLLTNLPIRCAADNIDAKVDTADGRNSFHGTVFQRVPTDVSGIETVAEPIKLSVTSSATLQNVPPTVTDMSPCTITGSPKASKSPRYENFRLAQYQDSVVAAA